MNLLKHNQNFRLVFIGALVSSVGDVLFSFAMGLYILEVTHSALMLSIYGVIGGVTWILLAPFGGVLVDRMSRVKIVYMTDFVRALNMMFCGVVMCLTKDPIITMLCLSLASFINSLNGALFGPASQAMIPLTVGKNSLVQANALMSLMYGVKDVFGMLLAGVLYASLGAIPIVFLNGISFLLSGITEMFIEINEELPAPSNKRSQLLIEVKQGFQYIICKNKTLIVIFIVMNFKNLALGPIQSVLVPYLINEQIGANETHLSYLYMAIALGGILGSLIATKSGGKRRIQHILSVSLVIEMATILIQWISYQSFNTGHFSYLGFLIMLFIAFFASGVVNVFIQVPVLASLQKLVDPAYYGRVMSLYTMMTSITMPISLMIGGIVIDQFGISVTYLISILFLLLGIVGIVGSNQLKKVPNPDKVGNSGE